MDSFDDDADSISARSIGSAELAALKVRVPAASGELRPTSIWQYPSVPQRLPVLN